MDDSQTKVVTKSSFQKGSAFKKVKVSKISFKQLKSKLPESLQKMKFGKKKVMECPNSTFGELMNEPASEIFSVEQDPMNLM